MTDLNPPLLPRDGAVLRIVAVCRISTPHQDKRSLDDQLAKLKQFVADHYDGPVEWTLISSQGSGEHLDRQELYLLEELIGGDRHDVVLAEVLGRVCRRRRACDLCELCVDHLVRLIAINDKVDTAEDGWEDNAFISTWHHERSNRDTSERIKRSLRNRFAQGGVCQTFQYGYIKPENAKSDAEVRKDPDAEPVYDEWFTRLEKGQCYTEVADWLNEKGIPTGQWCDSETWNGPLVSKATHNPILKGYRQRNQRFTKRVNETGRHPSRKAPKELQLFRHVPHFAFIEPARYDRVLKLLAERNRRYRRKGENGQDTRSGVSKKKTRWPGQHVDCGVCGRLFGWGGNGAKDDLMCTGAKIHRCWLGTAFNGPLAAERIATAVFHELESLPEFDEAFLASVNAEAKRLDGHRAERIAELSAHAQKLEREIGHVLAFIRGGDGSPRVRVDLTRLEQELAVVQAEQRQIEKTPSTVLVIPPVGEIKSIANAAVSGLAKDSLEFGKVMRLLIPRVVVFPYRLCTGGRVVLRAKFRMRVSNLLPDRRVQQALQQPLERVLTVDLFDSPQPEAFRSRICELRTGGMTQREAADQCGLTVTAAQDAAGLQRRMDALGLTDPYVAVTEPPDDYGKLRRHLHSRYRFEPLEDAGKF
jgi:site-specific DNA recombinase